MTYRVTTCLVALALTLPRAPATAQTSTSAWSATLANDIRVVSNITYLTANNWDAKLGVSVPRSPGPHPAVLHIHGGGWVGGSRESVFLRALPRLDMGLAVVNIS